jgi:hypothetical protein
MLSAELERQIESETSALLGWVFDEGIGLAVDAQGFAAQSSALERLYAQALALPGLTPAERHFALDNWSEARRVAHDYAVAAAMDRRVTVPGRRVGSEPLSWRNWREFTSSTTEAGPLREVFDEMLDRSAAIVPELEVRLGQMRADYRPHGVTPFHTWCAREGIAPAELRALLVQVGGAGRAAFSLRLNELSQLVFGRRAGPAELHALYLNRMYDPLAQAFADLPARRAPAADLLEWFVADTKSAFQRLGFDLARIPVDTELRPRKYPGAYCMPIAVPGDVRVAVRLTAPHYLVDMLYHELGHAAHFSHITPGLPFMDRYWIHSGVHETFSTLFEYLLGEPRFLRAQFGFGDELIERLLGFHHFKAALTGTWLAASALASVDAWLEELSWPAIEERYARHLEAFTGVPVPGSFARLEGFVSAASVYPAGYVLASVRVAHWLEHLRALGGAEWWLSSAAQADIRGRMAAGGALRFPAEWQRPGPFLGALA